MPGTTLEERVGRLEVEIGKSEVQMLVTLRELEELRRELEHGTPERPSIRKRLHDLVNLRHAVEAAVETAAAAREEMTELRRELGLAGDRRFSRRATLANIGLVAVQTLVPVATLVAVIVWGVRVG